MAKVIETTKPVERTFDIQELSQLDLRVLRQSLSDFVAKEEAHRSSMDRRNRIDTHDREECFVPTPKSIEEGIAEELLIQIRDTERHGLPDGPGNMLSEGFKKSTRG